jgi:dynein heavy chain
MLHKDSKDVYILGSLEEVQTVLDDSTINITTIASSRHVGPIKARVEEWARQLDLFSRTLVRIRDCGILLGHNEF